jgi:glycosyltransferase involved in cell wall biosynthesis
MRVLFVNRFFYPDHSATSQMLTDLAGDLRRAGMDVAVISGRQRIDDPGARLPAREQVGGIDVHRVWSTRFGRATLPGRAMDYLSFYLGAGWRLARECRAGDVLVAKTDPPLISVVAGWVAKRRGARLVNWLHDLFPEIAERLGVGFVGGPFARALQALRDRSLMGASCNVAIGSTMAARLSRLGVSEDRVSIIHNWCDGEAVQPLPLAGHRLREAWKLDSCFVVIYSGNMGYAHEFDTILDAADRLRAREDIVFLFIGGGVRRNSVEAEAGRRGLANVRFEPYQPRENLGESLTAANAHLVSLLPHLEGLMVPSKFYAVAAAGRPILFIGASDGELAPLIGECGCGYRIAPGAGDVLAERIETLAADPGLAQRQGAAARRLFEQRFDRRLAADAWGRVLRSASAETGPGGDGRVHG